MSAILLQESPERVLSAPRADSIRRKKPLPEIPQNIFSNWEKLFSQLGKPIRSPAKAEDGRNRGKLGKRKQAGGACPAKSISHLREMSYICSQKKP